MSDDINEDLIEATIRKVAAAKAAREQQQPGEGAPEPAQGQEPPQSDEAPPDDDETAHGLTAANGAATDEEDPIEATIRKVAAAKAAREQDQPGEGAPEPAQAQEPPQTHEDPSDDQETAHGLTAADGAETKEEDPIEATIRRVAAERAAREAAAASAEVAEPSDEPSNVEPVAASEDTPSEPQPETPAAPPEPVTAFEEPSAPILDDSPEPPPTIPTVPRSSAPPEPAIAFEDTDARSSGGANKPPQDVPTVPRSWEHAGPAPPRSQADDVASTLMRIEETLTATHQGIRTLLDRLDQVLAATRTAGPAFAPAPSPAPPIQDDDWDDQPQVSPLPFAAPPRPPVLRDPAPRTATAEHLVEQAHGAPQEDLAPAKPVIDTRPIPTPLPSFAPESKRGFDLLPRTYRITVEDKRRGVDLVPLHRALLGMDGVKDMSLLSYNNGIAMVALETAGDIDTEVLGAAVSRAMSRGVQVEQHNEQTLVVKLAEE
jgi:hypothetical protein